MSTDATNQYVQNATSVRANLLGKLVVATFILPWIFASAEGNTQLMFSWNGLTDATGIPLLILINFLALGICLLVMSKNADMDAKKKAQIFGGLGTAGFVLLSLGPDMPWQLFALIIGTPVMAFGARALSLNPSCSTGKLSTQIGAALVCLALLVPMMGKIPVLGLIDLMGFHITIAVLTIYVLLLLAVAVLALIISFTISDSGNPKLDLVSKVGSYWVGGLFALLGLFVTIYLQDLGALMQGFGGALPVPTGVTMVPLILFWFGVWYVAASEMATVGGISFLASKGEATAEAAPEPVVETAPEPVVETAPEPVVETAPEPVAEAAPEAAEETVEEAVEEAAEEEKEES